MPRDPERGLSLLRIKLHCCSRNDLIASRETMGSVRAIMLVNMAAGRIRAHGPRPSSRILLCSPPGAGKTQTAQMVSSSLGRPLAYVAFDSLASSYPGATASNMRRVLDYMGEQSMAVLFGEFDSIGKRRDDSHEYGELMRVVNNFMQMLDEYEGDTVIMAATNHHGMLDDAVWGRFDDTLYFDLPDRARRALLFEKNLGALGRDGYIDVRGQAAATGGHSAADIVRACVAALRKSIVRGDDAVGRDDVARSLSEQKRRSKLRGA